MDVRADLGLGPRDPLNPLDLAEFLLIPVVALSAFKDDPHSGADYFLREDQEAFSAVTIFSGSRRHIVHNDSHIEPRQNSNICHELSHGLLLHEPSPALSPDGRRDWDQVMEDEAQWMAGALLLPEDAVLSALRAGQPQVQLAFRYEVSTKMVQWRINETGARARVSRERARRRG
jgi:Zn-dependent peptidase ImmA (M78 family)